MIEKILAQEKIIEINSLVKDFKKLRAVNNLNLSVYKGDVFGFLGPNGAGKSTTIRMLLSLIRQTSGNINLFGNPISSDRKNILAKIGAIVEKPDFYGYLSAYKNLEILGKLTGKEISKSKIMQVLELVGLDSRFDSKVKTFSHGMKQRLGLAQSLLHDPELIILDEPTTGLDPQGMKEIRDLITYLSKEKGKTLFLSSHILHEVELVANRMIIINKGSAKVEGDVKDLLNAKKLKVSFEVDDEQRVKELIWQSGWKEKFESNTKSVFIFSLENHEISQLNKYLVDNNISISAVIPKRSLEDYFLKITEEAS
ncbi:MAG: ABC transporter ATP-binding protein [Ignavibacteriota bacterium]|nr:ABC transporter ATP-binding protein [Ignavibacteriota bacterium]MCO6447010.1 ABC transporter ATP-binding protein [Ignavibacterium album]MCZ2268880.1 ABC transporter ATP-binding protein [Ignavibacteriales bacterium]HMN18304.1 ABC transporter ATP-binding protein [Ignavibacteriaceae bacterium]MEB2353734.1 ABC transporter ATP-binding protein [Ignavibacteriales bacterium]